MNPVIRVSCLPELTERRLNKLHKNIVAAVVSVEDFGFRDENDMICLFPPDSMKKGLGEVIVIEVIGLIESSQLTSKVWQRLSDALADVVSEMFPKSVIETYILSPRVVCAHSTRYTGP